jgi:SAM-dependent methyltransferase
MLSLQVCPCCHGSNLRPLFAWRDAEFAHDWGVDQCADCSLAFVNPQPDWEELKPYYAAEYAPYSSPGAKEIALLTTEARAKRAYDGVALRPEDRVLEVGPGSGRFLLSAQSVCDEVLGVEPSEEASKRVAALGCSVFNGQLEAFVASYTGKPFSLIFLSHVLEHMPSPLGALRAMRTVMDTKSRIVLRVPNAGSWAFRRLRGNWMGTDLPRHLTHWNLTAIQTLAARAKMRITHVEFTSPVGIVEQSLAAYAMHNLHVPGSIVWLSPAAVRKLASHLADRWIRPELAMNMEIHLSVAP